MSGLNVILPCAFRIGAHYVGAWLDLDVRGLMFAVWWDADFRRRHNRKSDFPAAVKSTIQTFFIKRGVVNVIVVKARLY